LPDSTRTSDLRRRIHRLAASLFAASVLATGLAAVPTARADGDPASDVLASQSLFVPADGGFSQSVEARLSALLASAQRSGYPVRLALIATRADLGSVTALWSMPRQYAAFLGQELSLVYRGTLLVVMPDGFGVVWVGPRTQDSPNPATARLSAPRAGTPMVTAAMTAVQQLAAAAGHRLALPTATPQHPAGSGSALGSVDLWSWLALAAGVAVIAAAWGASLRARPPARLRAR
jgi:hypothetical protein